MGIGVILGMVYSLGTFLKARETVVTVRLVRVPSVLLVTFLVLRLSASVHLGLHVATLEFRLLMVTDGPEVSSAPMWKLLVPAVARI